MNRVIDGSLSPVVAAVVSRSHSEVVGGCRSPAVSEYALSAGPVLDRDVVHEEVGGVARRQASIDASGGDGDQAVGLLKGDPSSGVISCPYILTVNAAVVLILSAGQHRRCRESVHDAVGDDFAFGAVREVELKGFSGTHRVYPVELAA